MKMSAKFWFKPMVAAAALLALSTLAGTAGADSISFTITGTAQTSLYGYTAEQSYSFNWIVNSGFTNNPSSRFDPTLNLWSDEFVGEAPIFTGVSGDGLTGSWKRPIDGDGDPYSDLGVGNQSGTHGLALIAANDGGYSIGLQANGTDVVAINASDLRIGNTFTFPGSYTDPNVYFAGFTDTYTPTDGYIRLFPAVGTFLDFTATSVTISTIPEPSTALLTGLGLVALVFRRRRHAR